MSPVPEAFMGVWRRARITAPGLDDTTTRVFWVQGPSWYGDIRVPADSPRRAKGSGFAAYAEDELVGLARTESFAGQLTVTPDECAWRRDLDYQPPARFPDVGGWRFTGPDTLIETGVHLPYEEVWLREPDSDGPFAAFRPEDGSGLLVIAGDHFLAIGGRAEGLPGGSDLATLVREALGRGQRPLAESWLSMPSAYGRIAEGWRIVHSTQPWREGGPLWSERPGYEPASGRLTTSDGKTWIRAERLGDEVRLTRALGLEPCRA